MTKYKKYLQSKGYKLEYEYPWLPYDIDNHTFLEGITPGIDENGLYIKTFYNNIVLIDYIDRNGNRLWDAE